MTDKKHNVLILGKDQNPPSDYTGKVMKTFSNSNIVAEIFWLKNGFLHNEEGYALMETTNSLYDTMHFCINGKTIFSCRISEAPVSLLDLIVLDTKKLDNQTTYYKCLDKNKTIYCRDIDKFKNINSYFSSLKRKVGEDDWNRLK